MFQKVTSALYCNCKVRGGVKVYKNSTNLPHNTAFRLKEELFLALSGIPYGLCEELIKPDKERWPYPAD